MTLAKCIACVGRGFIWGRAQTNERARMAKRKCGYCKGTGKMRVKAEKP